MEYYSNLRKTFSILHFIFGVKKPFLFSVCILFFFETKLIGIFSKDMFKLTQSKKFVSFYKL